VCFRHFAYNSSPLSGLRCSVGPSLQRVSLQRVLRLQIIRPLLLRLQITRPLLLRWMLLLCRMGTDHASRVKAFAIGLSTSTAVRAWQLRLRTHPYPFPQKIYPRRRTTARSSLGTRHASKPNAAESFCVLSPEGPGVGPGSVWMGRRRRALHGRTRPMRRSWALSGPFRTLPPRVPSTT
jgi:hypothetical protein